MNRYVAMFGITILFVGCAEQPDNNQARIRNSHNSRSAYEPKGESFADLPRFLLEDEFTCATFAEAVNHYVDMGELKAIETLKALANSKPQGTFPDRSERRMGFICRALFEPKGKTPLREPGFGGLRNLPWNTMPLEDWPLYPVAKAGSSYFVLNEGYLVAGLCEPSIIYVSYCCVEGNFRKDRVPVPSKKEALNDLDVLRSSKAWLSLRWKDQGQGFRYELNENRAIEFLRMQAEQIPSE